MTQPETKPHKFYGTNTHPKNDMWMYNVIVSIFLLLAVGLASFQQQM